MSVLSACLNAFIERKKVVFFGAGAEGSVSFLKLQNAGSLVSYFVDNAPGKQGTKLHDISIHHPDRLKCENKEKLVIIVTAVDYLGAAGQLRGMGFSNIYASTYKDTNEIIPDDADGLMDATADDAQMLSGLDIDKARGLLADGASKEIFTEIIHKRMQNETDYSDVYTSEPMYFNDVFRPDIRQDEVYVDAGVHGVHTIVNFVFYVNGKYRKIYAFEPDETNYGRLSKDLPYIHNVELCRYGLSDVTGDVYFLQTGNGASKIITDERCITDEAQRIKVVRLDTYLEEAPTFIKMDIEGAEYNALLGASEIIKEHKPKLAVSLYHRADDLVRIPLLIHELAPEYKLYLKHHRTNYMETVLYAKP